MAPPPAKFVTLPYEVYDEIFKFLDLYSLRLMFEAYSAHPDYEAFRQNSTRHFKKRVEEVTVEHILDGDTSKVDFHMLSMFPPCKIRVEVTAGLMELARSYLQQTSYEQLNLKVRQASSTRRPICLRGIVKLVALELADVIVNVDEIPVTVEKLSFDWCRLLSPQSRAPSLVHLIKLTHFEITGYYYDLSGKLPPLITTIILYAAGRPPLDVSSLPNLKHIECHSFGNIPWAQLESAVVDEIPDGTVCANLKDLRLMKRRPSLKSIHCPNLQNFMLFHPVHFINDVFTDGQRDQLVSCKCFGQTNDLTLMMNVRVLHVIFTERLTKHTPLPPNLVELRVDSDCPVDGIPSQLEVFGYSSSERHDIVVRSSKLKRLLIPRAKKLTINCPNLEALTLKHYLSIEECNVPNVSELYTSDRAGLLERVPNLRRLTITEGNPKWADLVITQRLEWVMLVSVELSHVVLSANSIAVESCEFTHAPIFTTKYLQTLNSRIEDVTKVTCQKLECDELQHIPTMVEELTIRSIQSISHDLLTNCKRLKSLTITDPGPPPALPNKLALPASLKKFKTDNTKHVEVFNFDNVTKLDYISCDNCSLGMVDEVSSFIPDGLVLLGPGLWCHPDILN